MDMDAYLMPIHLICSGVHSFNNLEFKLAEDGCKVISQVVLWFLETNCLNSVTIYCYLEDSTHHWTHVIVLGHTLNNLESKISKLFLHNNSLINCGIEEHKQ